MKRYFKTMNLILIVLLIGISSSAGLAKDITITWWTNPWRVAPPGFPEDQAPTSEDFPAWASEEFMRLHPNVKVIYEVVPNAGYSQKITASILAGNSPDLLKDYTYKKQWAAQGLLEPIDSYLSAEDKEDWYEYTLSKGLVNGKHYIFPWNNSSNGMGVTMLLNPEIFAARNVEMPALPSRAWDIDEFLEKAKQLSYDSDQDGINDHFAFAFGAKDSENTLAWLYLFGGRMFNDDETEVILASPESAAALQFLLDAMHVHQIAPKGAEGMGVYDIIGLFHQGKTAIGYGGPYEIGRIDRYFKEGSLDRNFPVNIAPFPSRPGYDPIALGGSGGYVVFKQKDAEKRDMVMEFAKFLTNHENTAALKSLLYVTARKSVNEHLYDGSPFAEDIAVYTQAMEHSIAFYGSPEIDFTPAKDHLQAMFEAVFARTKTPEQALADFTKEANRILFNKR